MQVLKFYKTEYVLSSSEAVREIEREIELLVGLQEHSGIAKIYSYGSDGYVVKPSGKAICNIIYII